MGDIELTRVGGGDVTLHDNTRHVRRTVSLEPFELGVYPVTRALFADILGEHLQEDLDHPQHPASDVSWHRAVRFCNAASEWEGLEPAYRIDGEAVGWNTRADGYRLPTEAEWEFACRAGSTGAHYGPLRDVAWTSLDNINSPQDVGTKHPNLNGAFDMLGNVWEWCWDLLDPARYGDYRVFRGGGFANDSWTARASTRRGGAPKTHYDDVGFRVARGAFSAADEAQGWSALADRERAADDTGVPYGWAPQR